MNLLKIHFCSIIRVPKSIYNCQISLLAHVDLSVCPRHMWEVSAAPAASPRTMPNMLEARNAFDDERHDSATLTEVAERVVRRLTVLNQEYMLKTAGIVRSMAEELDEEPN